MAELKTKARDADVLAYIADATDGNEQIRLDSLALLELMRKTSGHEPRMWGPSIIGFGSYHYKSERSSQEGDWPLIGFSPRKAAFSLYVFTGLDEHAPLLEGLGKYKIGKACIYVNRLSDIDLTVLRRIIEATLAYLREKYTAGTTG